jgi:acyl-CoA thioesterase FadM
MATPAAPLVHSPALRRAHALTAHLCASSSSSSSLPRLSSFPFVLTRHTRFADVDRYAHVNNATYYAYFDSVINEFLIRRAGMKADDAVVGISAATSARFVSSVAFPARIHLALRVTKLSTRSVTYECAVFKDTQACSTGGAAASAPTDATTTLAALGTHAQVWVQRNSGGDDNSNSMRPTAIPDHVRQALSSLLVSEAVATSALSGSDSASAVGSCSGVVHPQSATRLLMVSPLHFRRNDESAADNSFMLQARESNTEVQRRAQAEFDAYVTLLRARGVEVEVHLPRPDVFTPDGVFPNNWFSTHAAESCAGGRKERLLVLYPMRHRTRQLERDPRIVASLSSRYDRVLDFTAEEEIDAGRASMLEGTGAAIFDHAGRTLYHAISERSTPALARKVANAIWPPTLSGPPAKVVSFHTRDAATGTPIYHTNVIMAVGTGWAVLCVDAIPDAGEAAAVVGALEASGREVVRISAEQVSNFCGNVLEVRAKRSEDGSEPERRFVAMSSRAFEAFTTEQRATLTRLGGELIHTPLTTIEHVGGGGARCMIAEIY